MTTATRTVYLLAADDAVCEAEESRDRTEGEAGAHQQCRVHGLAAGKRNTLARGRTPTSFAATLSARKSVMTPAPPRTAFAESRSQLG